MLEALKVRPTILQECRDKSTDLLSSLEIKEDLKMSSLDIFCCSAMGSMYKQLGYYREVGLALRETKSPVDEQEQLNYSLAANNAHWCKKLLLSHRPLIPEQKSYLAQLDSDGINKAAKTLQQSWRRYIERHQNSINLMQDKESRMYL